MTENEIQPASQQEEMVIAVPEVDHAAEFLQSQGVDATELVENVKKAAEKIGAKEVKQTKDAQTDDDNPYAEVAEPKQEKQEQLSEQQPSNDEDEISEIISRTKRKSEKPKINSLDDFVDIISKEFTIKDPGTFIESARKFRTQAQKLKEVQDGYEKLQAAFKEMPEDIFQALEKYYRGEDYKAVFTQMSGIDYRTEFEGQNIEALVKHYNPDIDLSDPYSDSYIDINDRNSPQTKAIINATKKQYEIDRKSVVAKRSEMEQTQAKLKEAFVNSVNASVEQLKAGFPNIKKQRIDAVSQMLSNEDFDSVLYNEDHTLKTDAAERLYYAMNGKDIVSRLLNTIEQLNESLDATVNKNTSGSSLSRKGYDPSGAPTTDAERLVSAYSGGGRDNPYTIKQTNKNN